MKVKAHNTLLLYSLLKIMLKLTLNIVLKMYAWFSENEGYTGITEITDPTFTNTKEIIKCKNYQNHILLMG